MRRSHLEWWDQGVIYVESNITICVISEFCEICGVCSKLFSIILNTFVDLATHQCHKFCIWHFYQHLLSLLLISDNNYLQQVNTCTYRKLNAFLPLNCPYYQIWWTEVYTYRYFWETNLPVNHSVWWQLVGNGSTLCHHAGFLTLHKKLSCF